MRLTCLTQHSAFNSGRQRSSFGRAHEPGCFLQSILHTHPAAITVHHGPPWAALLAAPQQIFCPLSNPFLNLPTLPPLWPCHPSLYPSEITSQQPQHATPISVPQHWMSNSHFIHRLHCITLGHAPAVSFVNNHNFSVFPLKKADPLVSFGCPSLSHCILLPMWRLEPHTLPQMRVHQLQQQMLPSASFSVPLWAGLSPTLTAFYEWPLQKDQCFGDRVFHTTRINQCLLKYLMCLLTELSGSGTSTTWDHVGRY